MNKDLFEEHYLNAIHPIYIGAIPSELKAQLPDFDTLWNTHPDEYHVVKILGKEVPTPRWQQAYGFDYKYTGSKQNALPISPVLKLFLDWCKKEIHPSLNGLLLNWYEGEKKHYIGPHRDAVVGLKEGSPIVTISLGEERIFRFRPWREKGYQDFKVEDGTVVIIPWATNKGWTHEVPHFARFKNRRISVTLRVYE
ncbi:alpha-ketoglutarate-dependent dioxygenase AlkB [Aureispira sp. CCB-E]|uniref:alpha-ketoglutarate-dependent dioxygenase AlkB n=1 Tax=Aureispira sp. CCB-E TaxID=3051121 RepID=UPI002869768E|nr:alpha-ketoglutarate-dependent dioxygenase AlkB [Aureispira sp. CCB-E]WMX12938.1 alpha-ketoglutarate-dependent dioxygenase AlkB [Aureispira sp. CCB-E]